MPRGVQRPPRNRQDRAFSLIELVVVVVIIGVIGAIAVPRMSGGSESAGDAKLRADMMTLQKAIDLYAAEHLGQFPSGTDIEAQLLNFTDIQGNVSPTKTPTHIYGRYLRALPALSVGVYKGNTKISTGFAPDVGWFYSPVSGVIGPNTVGMDAATRSRLVAAGILDR